MAVSKTTWHDTRTGNVGVAMDRVLTLNVGSSSLKWSLFDERDARIDGASASVTDERALSTIAARIGEVDCIAHRIVHGGDKFRAPVIIDGEVREALDAFVDLDVLHMRPALAVLDAARACWPEAEHVAAFDTAFHATLPAESVTYAVPLAWRQDYRIRRYGFHGLSVEYATQRAHELGPRRVRRLLVLHLGAGASATAVLDGRSVDTTMGMTPLEGIVMASRSGSIDPGVILHLLHLGLTAGEIERGIVERGGLAALAGGRSDMQTLALATDADARFARAQFVRSVAKHASSLLPGLGGLDAVAFTGGIGEHDSEVRELVANALTFAGIELDSATNRRAEDVDRVISKAGSKVLAFVIHAREDIMLLGAARQASCTEGAHATPEANPSRYRLQ